jgi:hypothetical protein
MNSLAFVEFLTWQNLVAVSGGAAWATIAGLFIFDKIRSTAGAQLEIDRAYEIARIEREGRERWEQAALTSFNQAAKATEVTEKVVTSRSKLEDSK